MSKPVAASFGVGGAFKPGKPQPKPGNPYPSLPPDHIKARANHPILLPQASCRPTWEAPALRKAATGCNLQRLRTTSREWTSHWTDPSSLGLDFNQVPPGFLGVGLKQPVPRWALYAHEQDLWLRHGSLPLGGISCSAFLLGCALSHKRLLSPGQPHSSWVLRPLATLQHGASGKLWSRSSVLSLGPSPHKLPEPRSWGEASASPGIPGELMCCFPPLPRGVCTLCFLFPMEGMSQTKLLSTWEMS